MTSDQLSILDSGDYLLIVFSGIFSVAAGKQCVDKMAEACEAYGHSKVLLDCRKMTGDLPLFDRFQVAEYGATKRRQIGRLALLNREDVVLPNNFVENVSVNRGMTMKIFTDFTEAEIWLSQEPPNTKNEG